MRFDSDKVRVWWEKSDVFSAEGGVFTRGYINQEKCLLLLEHMQYIVVNWPEQHNRVKSEVAGRKD